VPGEYTVAAVVAPVAVVALELVALRTGLLRQRRYWAALAIVLAFQIPVDGWLTAGDRPVVGYAEHASTGLRLWHIPVEDFGFGYALVTLTLLLWARLAPEDGDA
jgi:lycopene cyclase domain-containing protein